VASKKRIVFICRPLKSLHFSKKSKSVITLLDHILVALFQNSNDDIVNGHKLGKSSYNFGNVAASDRVLIDTVPVTKFENS
jgi:hypothetical protein